MRRILAIALLATFGAVPVLAEEPPDALERLTVEVWAMATSPDGFTPAQQRVLDAFERAVQVAGLAEPGGRWVTLFVDATDLEINGEAHLVMSVTILSRLPDEVVSLGAEAEAFYLTGNFAGRELPEEGAAVRRDFSADWLRQYHMIDYHFVEILTPEGLDQRATEIVNDL